MFRGMLISLYADLQTQRAYFRGSSFTGLLIGNPGESQVKENIFKAEVLALYSVQTLMDKD